MPDSDDRQGRRGPSADEVFSSEIESITYDEDDHALDVKFALAPFPFRFWVPRRMYEAFLAAPDKHAHFRTHIEHCNVPKEELADLIERGVIRLDPKTLN